MIIYFRNSQNTESHRRSRAKDHLRGLIGVAKKGAMQPWGICFDVSFSFFCLLLHDFWTVCFVRVYCLAEMRVGMQVHEVSGPIIHAIVHTYHHTCHYTLEGRRLAG